MSKKKPAPISTATPGEPGFLVTVTARAWTEKQADALAKQIAMILAGYDMRVTARDVRPVSAISDTPEAAPAPAAVAPRLDAVPPQPGTFTPAARPVAPVTADTGTTGAAIVVVGSADAPRPFGVGDVLRDVHVEGRTVTVTAVDDSGFAFEGGVCPWKSAECYERVSGPEAAKGEAKKEHAAKAKRPAVRSRAKKPAASAKPARKR